MISTLRFGIIQLQDRPWATLAENCQKVESLGYDSFWVGDHFVNPHNIGEDWFDGWSVLTALADCKLIPKQCSDSANSVRLTRSASYRSNPSSAD